MSRTTIDIDDDLVAQVMYRHGIETIEDAVDFALRRVARDPMTRDEALALQGTGWVGDLEAMRSSDFTDW